MTNEAPGLPDAVLSGLAAMVGAGLLAGIAPATDAAGAWVLAGLILAACVTFALGLSTSEQVTPLAVLGRSAGAAAIAVVFGRYLVPEHPVPTAVALIAVATAITAFGVTPPPLLTRAGVLVVLAVLAIFVVACLAIEPPPDVSAPDDPAGIPAATAFLVFAFLGTERKIHTRRHRLFAIGAALVIYLAVTGAALHQLGGTRLALSPVPLRDALFAADASGLDRLFTVSAVLATVLALLGVLADIRADAKPLGVAAAGLAATLGALVLNVPTLIILAVALMVAHQLVVTWLRASGRRPPRSARS